MDPYKLLVLSLLLAGTFMTGVILGAAGSLIWLQN